MKKSAILFFLMIFATKSFAENSFGELPPNIQLKKDSIYNKIFDLAVNNNPEVCNKYLEYHENKRYSGDHGYFDNFNLGVRVKGKGLKIDEVLYNLKTKTYNHYYIIHEVIGCGGACNTDIYKIIDYEPTKNDSYDFIIAEKGYPSTVYYDQERELITGVGRDDTDNARKLILYSYNPNKLKFEDLCVLGINKKKLMPPITDQFEKLIKTYKKISDGVSGCQTGHTTFTVNKDFIEQFYKLLLYPSIPLDSKHTWDGYKNFDIYKYFESWSKLSLLNKRDFKVIDEEFQNLRKYISGYLDNHIDYSSEEQRNSIIDYVMRETLYSVHVYPFSYVVLDDFIYKIQDGTVEEQELKNNLSDQYESMTLYKSVWVSRKELKYSPSHEQLYADPPIFHALDNKELLKKMISIGYDVNAKNWFNKTPLMVAAHLNNIEAVKMLIESGANLEDVMGNPDESLFMFDSRCVYNVKRENRTALMYAAENASYKLISYLIEQGANIKAKDSKGNGVDFYINKSEILSNEQKKKLMSIMKL